MPVCYNIQNSEKVKNINQNHRTAFHEAGHVVICTFLGVVFKHVQIYKKPDLSYGKVKGAKLHPGKIKEEIQIAQGGYIAEELFMAQFHKVFFDDSAAWIEEISSDEGGDDYSIRTLAARHKLNDYDIADLHNKTFYLLSGHLVSLCEVAIELLEKKKLNYFEVQKIIKER